MRVDFGKGFRRFFSRDGLGYLFIAPVVLYLATFLAYPVVYNFVLSFFKSSYGTITPVGLGNYYRLIVSRGFGQVMLNTVIWTAGNMTIMYALALIAAVILRTIPRGRVVFRVILLLPWVIPGIVAGILWRYMLHPHYGVVNDFLLKLGFIRSPVLWLADPHTSLASVMLAYIWKVYPYIMVLLMAGLEGIPNEIYEAASVDGATAWQQFRHVTLPLLGPVTRAIMIIMGVWTFNSFDLTYIMTKGGPLHASEVIVYSIYHTAFERHRMGYAAAQAYVLFAFILALTIIQFKFQKRWVLYQIV